MTQPRKHAVLGRLIKITPVAGRNAYALTIDVAEEDHDALAELFPLPSTAHAFEVCVFKPTTDTQKAVAASAAAPEPERPAANDRTAGKWHLANHVALRCTELTFWQFLQEHSPSLWGHAETVTKSSDCTTIAAEVVRRWCGVSSRRDIVPGSTAEDCWNTLELEYEQFQRERAA